MLPHISTLQVADAMASLGGRLGLLGDLCILVWPEGSLVDRKMNHSPFEVLAVPIDVVEPSTIGASLLTEIGRTAFVCRTKQPCSGEIAVDDVQHLERDARLLCLEYKPTPSFVPRVNEVAILPHHRGKGGRR